MSIHKDINSVYEWGHSQEGLEMVNSFHKNQEALQILTNVKFQETKKRIEKIKDRIKGRSVVEIGAGVGFAAIEIAKYAQQVVAIESDPAWSWIFTQHLYKLKPDNLIWIFGSSKNVLINFPTYYGDDHAAEESYEIKHFQVAVIFTRSGIKELRSIAELYADEVIMYYQEYEE